MSRASQLRYGRTAASNPAASTNAAASAAACQTASRIGHGARAASGSASGVIGVRFLRRRAVAASPRGLDAQDVSRLEVLRREGRERDAVELVPAGQAVPPARGSTWSEPPPLREERQATRLEGANLTHDSVAASKRAVAARAETEAVPLDPQRIRELQCLDRRVEGVGHRDVDGGR